MSTCEDADARKGKKSIALLGAKTALPPSNTAKASCCCSQRPSFPSCDLEVTQQALDRAAGRVWAAWLGHGLSSFCQTQKQHPDRFLLLSRTQGSRQILSLGKSLVTGEEETQTALSCVHNHTHTKLRDGELTTVLGNPDINRGAVAGHGLSQWPLKAHPKVTDLEAR